ncbi:MAG TPA: FliM/FliN family flagellar motor switch protein [Solirubrobacteraceae bacterium]|jgi:flagellar motor switch protein FliM|nr:FliM/FliN family flagellar motor switch protein [Solirubrobacteraceae bacterium]
MAVSQEETHSDASERIRTLDFSQPTKFTTELRRRIIRALDLFCESLGGWMAGELKAEIELVVTDISQHTWAAAKAQLPADSIAVAVEAEAIERHMLMSVELPLVLQALECLLGGDASQAPTERHLTEIDWVLTRGVLDAIVHQLSIAWDELGGPELVRGEVDMEGDAGVLTPIGEPTLSVTLELKIDGLASTMALLIPWAAIEPITERIRDRAGQPSPADARGAGALRRGLAGAHVLLRAEVGSLQMPIERMLELTPGALLALEDSAEDGVLLFAEAISLGRGRPGRSGARRAVKLTSTGEPPVEAEPYAKLGRAELERARAHLEQTRESAEGREILRSIFVRVWAELGRTHLPLGRALELAQGAVVELDQRADAPVELFANGLCFANGSLVVTGEGAWGVQLAELLQ